MNGRRISFTFGGFSLNITGYSITAEDRLSEIAMINGNISTSRVGIAAIAVKISGKLPSVDCRGLLTAARPLVGLRSDLTVDGIPFQKAMLDSLVIEPETADGFAEFSMKFHI